MSVAELKKVLLKAIDAIDDEQKLERMLTLVQDTTQSEFNLTEHQVAILKQRESSLASGEAKLIPWEEVDAKIRSKHGF